MNTGVNHTALRLLIPVTGFLLASEVDAWATLTLELGEGHVYTVVEGEVGAEFSRS